VNKEQKPPGIARRRFRPYPKYKDSGVEWLGAVPANWRITQLGRLGAFAASGIDKNTIEGELLIKMVNYLDIYKSTTKILDGSINYMDTSCPTWKAKKYSLLRGDILFTPSSETADEIAFSAVVVEDMPDTVYSYHLIRFRPNNHFLIAVNFSKYICNNNFVLSQFTTACKGTTRQILTREDFKRVVVVIPSKEEQEYITNFLDREMAKIDMLIEKKERLIELLQEKRSALITQAVTKGLDPAIPMKDSGVEWLGKIPAHWNVRRLRFLVSLNDETLSEKADPQFEMIYVDIGGVDRYQGIFERAEYLFEAAPSRARRIVRDGDVIISTVRTYLRAITRIKSPENNLIVSTGFAVIRPSSSLNSEFAAYALQATYFVESIVANSTGVSYPAIDTSKVSNFSIAFPELLEQQQIAAFLDRETAKIDALVNKIREAINSLKEYRTALISAAVTGKIDVRESRASALKP